MLYLLDPHPHVHDVLLVARALRVSIRRCLSFAFHYQHLGQRHDLSNVLLADRLYSSALGLSHRRASGVTCPGYCSLAYNRHPLYIGKEENPAKRHPMDIVTQATLWKFCCRPKVALTEPLA